MWPWAILLLISAPEAALNVLATITLAVAIPLATTMLAGIATFWGLASLSRTWHKTHSSNATDARWSHAGPVRTHYELQANLLARHLHSVNSSSTWTWLPQLVTRTAALAISIYIISGSAMIDLHEGSTAHTDLYCSSCLGSCGGTPLKSVAAPARILTATRNVAQGGNCQTGPNLLMLIDSGASFHIHNLPSDLTNIRPCSDVFEGIDRVRHQATCIGDLEVECHDQSGEAIALKVNDVRIFPKVRDSLVSVSQLWEQHRIQVLFGSENAIVVNGKGSGVDLNLPIVKRNGVFEWHTRATSRLKTADTNTNGKSTCPRICFGNKSMIRSTRAKSYFNDYSADVAAHHMHLRLHAGIQRLRRLPLITADAPPSLSRAAHVRCEHCAIANSTCLAHSGSRYTPSYPGRLIHADIAGQFNPTKIGMYQWLLILVDDHSRFKFAYPLRDRRDAPAQLRKFVASFNSMARRTQDDGRSARAIGSLLNDKAGEFISKEFKDFLAGNLIDQKLVPAEVKAINGVAERAVRTVLEQMRSLMVASNAPKGFWNYAVQQAVDILNRTTCPPNTEQSSYELLSGERPRILSILPFGCRMYAVRVKQGNQKSTHYPRAFEGINLGRSVDTQGAYCVWVPDQHKVVTTSEVYHDEALMPWRPAGSQRISDPGPIPADGDADQPVTIPLGDDPGTPPAPANTLAEEFKRVVSTSSGLQGGGQANALRGDAWIEQSAAGWSEAQDLKPDHGTRPLSDLKTYKEIEKITTRRQTKRRQPCVHAKK